MSALEVRVKRARDVYGAAFGLVAYCSAQHGACTRRTRTPMLSVKCTLVVRIAYVYPWEKYWFIWTLQDAFAYNHSSADASNSYSQYVYHPPNFKILSTIHELKSLECFLASNRSSAFVIIVMFQVAIFY